MGKPLLRKARSERVKTNGRTGRMHGLRMVSTPPKNTINTRTIRLRSFAGI
jgi:hypothetical protein